MITDWNNNNCLEKCIISNSTRLIGQDNKIFWNIAHGDDDGDDINNNNYSKYKLLCNCTVLWLSLIHI